MGGYRNLAREQGYHTTLAKPFTAEKLQLLVGQRVQQAKACREDPVAPWYTEVLLLQTACCLFRWLALATRSSCLFEFA